MIEWAHEGSLAHKPNEYEEVSEGEVCRGDIDSTIEKGAEAYAIGGRTLSGIVERVFIGYLC